MSYEDIISPEFPPQFGYCAISSVFALLVFLLTEPLKNRNSIANFPVRIRPPTDLA